MRGVLSTVCLALFALLAPPAAAQKAAPCAAFPVGAASVECGCTGSDTGSVWGSDPYTGDSSICVAARHAGVVGPTGGDVVAYGLPGRDAYPGSSANGVTTSSWGGYGSSFSFVAPAAAAACGRFPGGEGPYVCSCTGAEGGTVWGSGPYTSDSALCVAARHAGVIDSRGGTITVLGMRGLASYAGSQRNGVTTSNWGSYGESVVFNTN